MNRGLACRLRIVMTDLAFALCIVAVLVACPVPQAHAYVDPSVMTYTIQALAGVAVALSAVIGVVWRRVRRRLLKALRIDENAGKQQDGVVHALDVDAPDYRQRLEQADEDARRMRLELAHERPERLFWGARFFFALAASIMLCFTVMVVAPLEIVANSGLSLFFTVADVWVPLVVCALVVTLALAFAVSLFRGRAFDVILAVVVALGIAAYVQAMFLNVSLPMADGSHVAWGDHVGITIVSAIVWLALFAGAIVFALRKSLLFKGLASATCCLCIVAQAIALGLLLATPNTGDLRPIDEKPTVTMAGMLDVSSKDNVIMIVLDTYDVRFLEEALEEDPDALDEFTGFTCFTNTVGSMIPTRYAMSSLLTGYSLDDDDEAFSTDLIIDWYTRHNLLDDINAQGYQTDVYASDVYDAIGVLADRAENIGAPDREIDSWGSVGVLLKCSLYRDLPWLFKPPFWFYTDEVNNAVIVHGQDDLATTTWNIDDAGYYQLLVDRGLSVDDIGERGSFRVLHFQGAHYPFFMNRYAQTVDEETTRLEQCLGSLFMTSEYLRQLKELGVYDDATIIVTADHGEWYLADEIERPSTPILLVKPAQDAAQASRPVRFSTTPTGHLDVPATILGGMGADASGYGGMSVFDVPADERTRTYNATSVIEPKHEYAAIKQWKIEGDSRDWNNWSKTGKEWPIE